LIYYIPILKTTAVRIAEEKHVRTYSTNLTYRLYFLTQDESTLVTKQNHKTKKFKTAPIIKSKKEGGWVEDFAHEEKERKRK
jgi:hypothetical protein